VETLTAVRSALRTDPEVQLAVVFGSSARGTASGPSDIDIGVVGVAPSRLPALAVRLGRLAGRISDAGHGRLVGLGTVGSAVC
jgi:predicted nucleotidyltransferase